MSDLKHRQHDNDDDGHDGDGSHDDDHAHCIDDDRELLTYVHDMLRSLETITAGRAFGGLSRSIGEAKTVANALLWGG